MVQVMKTTFRKAARTEMVKSVQPQVLVVGRVEGGVGLHNQHVSLGAINGNRMCSGWFLAVFLNLVSWGPFAAIIKEKSG